MQEEKSKRKRKRRKKGCRHARLCATTGAWFSQLGSSAVQYIEKMADFPGHRQGLDVPVTGGASDSVIDDLEAVFGAFCAIFRTPSTWTSSPGFQGDEFLGALEHSQLQVLEGSGVPGSPGFVLPGDPAHACTINAPM